MSTTLAIGILSAVVSAVLAGVLGIVGGMFIERRRSRDEDSRRHADQVKTHVFEPLIRRIESYCLPVTVGTLPPIDLKNERQAGPIGDWADRNREWTEIFVPLEFSKSSVIGRNRRGMSDADVRLKNLDKTLLSHVQMDHLADLLEKYEGAENGLLDWQKRLGTHALKLVEELSQSLGIPIVQGLSQSPGIQKSIALFVIGRQLNITDSTLYCQVRNEVAGDEAYIVDNQPRIYAVGPHEQMKYCLSKVQDFIDGDGLESERHEARRINRKFAEIASELRTAAARPRLPGRCSYV